ncbi:MAG: permease-like cell division protein FtsX [Gammaproteobacteria bacterium]|nr:permease-like cell division protein FtsX [Gammaproteobacteria bacterium]MDH5272603.1 permease-like cell division protein FtsX [Gammaproteobacteria bacterium]
MKQWFERHVQTLVGSLGRLWQQPFATMLTIVVIGIALALPACLHVLVQNVRVASGGWNSALDISVYMKPDASLDQAKRAAERIRQRRDVDEVTLIEADAALAEFRRNSGFGAALDALKDNPLPHALVVRPDAEFREASRVQALSNELRKIDGVDIVQLDTEWVSRFNAILDVIRRGVFLAAVLFALGILVIIGNTIRLDIENRRGEIEVTKLVGGSDAFVRRPFLYNGVWYGLAGGLIAGLIVATVVAVLNAPVQRIAGLYGSQFELQGVGFVGWVALLLGGALLGWLGSFIVATRELREIEPK